MIAAFLAVAIAGALFALGCSSRTRTAPGLVSGRLTPCPASPNCVSSEPGTDEAHRVAPIAVPDAFDGDIQAALRGAIEETGGEIAREDGAYLAAEYRSALFRFVDDVELRLDEANRWVHIRSASRVGHSDLGANRKRVKALRKAITTRLADAN